MDSNTKFFKPLPLCSQAINNLPKHPSFDNMLSFHPVIDMQLFWLQWSYVSTRNKTNNIVSGRDFVTGFHGIKTWIENFTILIYSHNPFEIQRKGRRVDYFYPHC